MGGLWARAHDSAKMEEIVALLRTSSANWNESSLKRGRSIRLQEIVAGGSASQPQTLSGSGADWEFAAVPFEQQQWHS